MPEPDFPAQHPLQPPQSRVQRSRSSGSAIALLFSLMTTGGLTGVIWLGQAAIGPSIVQAYTTRVDVSIDNLPGETYETLMRRAEAVARAAAQRSFDRDILVTGVSVIITAQNGGATAPLLSLEVSRAQWRSFPDTRRWATYYRSARALLGFERVIPPSPAPTSTPAVQVSPTTPQPVTPGTPAPAGTTPTNAPGTTTAPAGTTTAPAGTTPAPAGTTPTNAPGTPAPAGTTTPATPATPATTPTTNTSPTPTTNTSPTPTTNTSPTPTPPTTPGTPGSTPAPGTTP